VDLESAPKIDLIVVATFSGDYVFPPVSAALARELGIKSCQIFDLQANCAGFVSALTVAADRLAGDLDMSRALVVGLEVNSTYVSMSDQDSAVYLSDAAGAVVLEKTSADGTGLLASRFDVDASSYEAVRMRGGGSRFRNIESSSDHNARFMEMNGIATWKQAVTNLPRVIRECCSKARLELHEVDFVIFHQANLNMINYIMRKLKIHESKTYTNVARIGNSGAASVPVALSEAVSQGKIKSGDIVLLAAVGAGFNFGASVWRWR
jgi:3-oxoacyl-[acyl-carrier-protein] synthase-3